MNLIKFYIVFLFVFIATVFPQPTVETSVDSTEYQIGDYIYYDVTITHNAATKIFFPAIADSIKPFEIVKTAEPVIEKTGNNIRANYMFTIAGYDSGDMTIPSFLIPYKANDDTAYQFVSTDSITVTVHSLPAVLEKDIEDIKEPLLLPMDWRELLIYIVIGLIVLAVAYYFYRRWKKRKTEIPKEKPKPVKPAFQIALERLDELEKKELWQKGEIKQYHTEITEVIRAYFEERFRFNALEMTTNEILQTLHRLKGGKAVLEAAKEFLYNADMVKFAKFEPLASVNEEMMRQAREIVTSTKRSEPMNGKEVV